jgi:hypothetical protein
MLEVPVWANRLVIILLLKRPRRQNQTGPRYNRLSLNAASKASAQPLPMPVA